jgi:hypothetical protein
MFQVNIPRKFKIRLNNKTASCDPGIEAFIMCNEGINNNVIRPVIFMKEKDW